MCSISIQLIQLLDGNQTHSLFSFQVNSLNSNDPINVVLCDFGISRVESVTQTGTIIGTTGYIAPEILNNESYDKAVDVSN